MVATDRSIDLVVIVSNIFKSASVTAPVTAMPLIKLELLMLLITPTASNAAAVSFILRTTPESATRVACQLFKTL